MSNNTDTNSNNNYPTIHFHPTISKTDKEIFINRVINDTTELDKSLMFFNLEESFISNFLDMFTDFEMSFEEVDNVLLGLALREAVMTHPLAVILMNCIEKQISYNRTSNDAVEAVYALISKLTNGVDAIVGTIVYISDLIKDGKIFDIIPEDKLSYFIESFTNAFANNNSKVSDEDENNDENNMGNIFDLFASK